MQLNPIVFAAPRCSYSSESLFKQIIYVPQEEDGLAIPCLFLDHKPAEWNV